MKVLVLGLPRTGTQSIADALEKLGISPIYHMREVGKNKHQALWIEAMEAKFEGKGTPYGREEFEKILAGFEGLADYPAAIFPTELIDAYPEAAVILSTRPEEGWNKSMMSTLVHYQLRRPVDEDPSSMGAMSAKYHRHCWGDDFEKNGTAFFYAHNQAVREASKDRKFLEYSLGSGWKPLCDFLGYDVPTEPFPRSDDWVRYKENVEKELQKDATGKGGD